MTESYQASSMLSDIAYNDYLVMFCYADAEWSRRRPILKREQDYEMFLSNHRHFTTNCCKYRNRVNGNYKKFCRANDTEPKKPLAPYLFNPICFVPFGHADDLYIVLLDDFDPIHHISSHLKTTIEEICIGFCPKVESICADNSSGIFCDLHTLLGPKPRLPKHSTGDGSTYWPALHEFQEKTPLMVFTKFKVHGFGTLGQAMLFQQGLFKAMAAKIQELKMLLYEGTTGDNNVASLMSKEDIDSAKSCFLDLQGAEEVGILTFCRNYSLAMKFILGLRTLTFGDVFGVDGRIEELFRRCKSHGSFVAINQSLRGEQPSRNIDMLRDLHVFRWTHCSLAVSPKAVFDPDRPHCNGYVGASLGIQISPGHECKVEQIIGETLKKHKKTLVKKDQDKLEYHHAQVGIEDLIVPYASLNGPDQPTLISLSSVLSSVARNRYLFGTKKTRQDSGRDVIDTITRMIIPVPKITKNTSSYQVDLECGKRKNLHFSPFADVLPLLQQRLCYFNELSIDEKEMLPQSAGRLDLTALRQATTKCEIPISLRRTIEDLYRNFAIVVADPFLFDTILDLYDTFATLHAVITDHLESLQKTAFRCKNNDLPWPLGEARIKQLSDLVDAMRNAFMHRTLKIYPDAPIRDMAIDFRGGLNQILLAADAPVKCGLGLLRKYAMGIDKSGYNKVGGLTRISFMPGARCYSLILGTEEKAQLAYFEVDVPHILHVGTYCENLHESFHLSFNALCRKKKSNYELFTIQDSFMSARVDEVFANLMCQMFIFGSDVESAMSNYLINYSKSLTRVGQDDSEIVARFMELFLRLFLVMEAVPTSGSVESWDDVWRSQGNNINNAEQRFNEALAKFGPFFSDYDRLWNGSKGEYVREYCSKQFKEIYPKVAKFMPTLWSEAIGLYRDFAKNELYNEDGSLNYNENEIRDNIEKGMNEGRPIIRGLYRSLGDDIDNDPNATRSAQTVNKAMNPLLLICNLLYQYIQVVRKAGNKKIHLYRRPGDRVVEYAKGPPWWYEFQVEVDGSAMFCPVPSARRRRLRRQIVILKTFWDISSTLRERRLWQIISDNWSEASTMME